MFPEENSFESPTRLMVLKPSAPWTLVFDELENVKSWQSFLNSWKIKLMNRIFVFEFFCPPLYFFLLRFLKLAT